MKEVAVITGGSSGLGFQMANVLAEQGYLPVILARRKQMVDQAVEKLKADGYAALGFSCDVSNEGELRMVFERVKEEYGRIDFLILNAGVVSVGLLSEYTDTKELKKDIEIDLWGTILSAYIFLPLMQPKSKILMVSSGFGLMGAAGYTTYAAAKAGIINFAEALRRELLCKDISVHVTCPGDMDTPQFHEEQVSMPEWMKKDVPRGMLHPRDAAKRILKKCGKRQFLVIINGEISLLILLTKLLPRKIRDWIIDKMFPRPQ